MRVLLIDNSKPAIRVHTPRLVETLRDDLRCEVLVCETAEQVSAALALERRHDWDAVVISGSSLNVSESLETSRIAKDLMVLMHMRDVALLGVCFGMQLLAVANGGRVERLVEMQDGARRGDLPERVAPRAGGDGRGALPPPGRGRGVPGVLRRRRAVRARRHRDDPLAGRTAHGGAVPPRGERGGRGTGAPGALPSRRAALPRPRRPEVRISRETYARIALSLGGASPIQVAVQYGVDPGTVLTVWNRFRDRFRIPPMLA